MTIEIFKYIRSAIDQAPEDTRTAELHLQMIKYADELADLTGRQFAEALGISTSFGTEFSKMKNIAARLKAAGLDVEKL